MKQALYLLFVFTISSQITFGQNRQLTDQELNSSTASKITIANSTCEKIDQWFKSDVRNKTIFLFLQGGIVPVVYTTDKAFEDKYGLYFNDSGCTGFNEKCVLRYNNLVFNYLTYTHGKEWIKEIRKDVVGFKAWKKNRK